jgi:hypothetical protein
MEPGYTAQARRKFTLRSIERQGTLKVHLYITNTLATFQLLSSIEATFKNLAATAFYHF